MGDEVLALLPVQDQPLSALFSGLDLVERRIDVADYLVKTPDRRKKYQLCDVNTYVEVIL